jgi:DNA-binding transcriptional regulator/RsmH inhibitor MraZ
MFWYKVGVEMEMEMPLGVFTASVDDRGRLNLPKRFYEAMAIQEQWFIAQSDGGNGLHIRQNRDGDEETEIDGNGRMLIPAVISQNFKGRMVRLYWAKDRVVVTAEV